MEKITVQLTETTEAIVEVYDEDVFENDGVHLSDLTDEQIIDIARELVDKYDFNVVDEDGWILRRD